MNIKQVDIGQTGVDCVQVGLLHVRAADDIRIVYDFDRDGWSILQASRFMWAADDKECNADWQEVAFIQAWAREDEEYRKSITGE